MSTMKVIDESNEEIQSGSSVIDADVPKVLELLNNLNDQMTGSLKSMELAAERVKESDSTSKGISFLETKFHTQLSYLINLAQIVMLKLNGEKISGASCIERLIEYRVVLERMRPVDQKLKYQIDKFLRIASSGKFDADDPLQFKANPNNLMNKFNNDSSSSDEDESKEEKDKRLDKKGIYVPPKLAAVPYDGDELEQDKQKQVLDRARKKALSSSIMEDLRREYYDGPEEIMELENFQKAKLEKNRKERIQYEEDNFVRLGVSKKEKNSAKKVTTVSNLGSIARFGDLSALDGSAEIKTNSKKRSKSKGSFKNKKGSKKRKRFH